MRTLLVSLIAACSLLVLPVRNASAQNSADKQRTECLNKFCPGDVPPPYDKLKEVPLKLNGQWFIGPREYFSGVSNAASFEWWEHKPLRPSEKRPPGAQAIALAGRGYDIVIEIFLHPQASPMPAASMYSVLLKQQAEGNVLNKATPREGLEAWRVRDSVEPQTWYVATKERDSSGQPATLMCRRTDAPTGRCSSGFMWQPGISVDLRFRAVNAKDWPEIYQEVVRVLQQLRKA